MENIKNDIKYTIVAIVSSLIVSVALIGFNKLNYSTVTESVEGTIINKYIDIQYYNNYTYSYKTNVSIKDGNENYIVTLDDILIYNTKNKNDEVKLLKTTILKNKDNSIVSVNYELQK